MHAVCELEDLWAALFGEPPSIRAEPALLSEVIVASLPLPPYGPLFAPADPGSAEESDAPCLPDRA